MPKQMMDEEGEMNSLYGDGEPGTGAAKGQETTDQEREEQGDEGTTAIVPMKLLQGKHPEPIKEGEEIVVKAVKVYGDEVEIAYSETKPGEIGEGEGYESEIDKMDNPGMPGY